MSSNSIHVIKFLPEMSSSNNFAVKVIVNHIRNDVVMTIVFETIPYIMTTNITYICL